MVTIAFHQSIFSFLLAPILRIVISGHGGASLIDTSVVAVAVHHLDHRVGVAVVSVGVVDVLFHDWAADLALQVLSHGIASQQEYEERPYDSS